MHIEELSKYNVSDGIITRLKELGFEILTEAQENAVIRGLFDRKSLLISAPTNTGKTFIGELAALNASKQNNVKQSFFLVPLKALAEQMYREFNDKYSKWGLNVAISTADHYEYDGDLDEYHVVISTYEKLSGLVIKRPDLIDSIGLIVVDEIQHVGDDHRGVSLEMLLTRLMVFGKDIQIIGLSATISNAELLSKWLKCNLISVTKRETELREGIVYTGKDTIKFRGIIVNNGDFLYKEFNSKNTAIEPNLQLNSIPKIIESSKTEQCLVFTDTQTDAEIRAEMIARDLPIIPESDELIKELNDTVESTPITAKLKKVLSKGVAFHHAGLLMDERRIVESGFRRGLIRVICTTTTLAAGINTPAKNVIILKYSYYNDGNIPVTLYKNMSGRAARLRGKDLYGRSILFANNERELELLWDNYVNAKPERIISQITKKSGLDRSILGLISTKTCSLRDELTFCLEMTFYGFIISSEMPNVYKVSISKTVGDEISKLSEMGLLTESAKLELTELGIKCAEEMLSPSSIVFLYQSLMANKDSLTKVPTTNIVQGIIHLCCSTYDSDLLYPPRITAEEDELDAIWASGKYPFFCKPTDRQLFLKSLRTTRMLLRWVEGAHYHELSQYAPPGVINRIAENSHWISRGLVNLCQKPLFDFNHDLLNNLIDISDRIYFGVPKEAVAAMKLHVQGVHRRRALNLAASGYVTIEKITDASIDELAKVADIGPAIAARIKEATEKYLNSQVKRMRSSQLRIALKKNKNKELILGLYEKTDDDFSKHIVKILCEEIGLLATYVGDNNPHEPDIIIKTQQGIIAIECKRHKKDTVTAIEAEEILGKGSKYTPIASVTIGYPEFAEVARQSANNSKVTLLTASVFGEMVTQFWLDKLTTDSIITLLKCGKPIYELEPYYLKP